MTGLDVALFRSLLECQANLSIYGAPAEIGVHLGRSFFLLCAARRDGERALAVDLFADDTLYTDSSGKGRGYTFHANRAKLGVVLSQEEIFKGYSNTLTADEIRRRIGEVRLFSVDGGHMYDDVLGDLKLAADVMVKDGIIAIDDFMNGAWPEVTFASYDWFKQVGMDWVPFASTPAKLLVARQGHAEKYISAIEADPYLSRMVSRKITILGHPVLNLRRSMKAKIIEKVRNRIQL